MLINFKKSLKENGVIFYKDNITDKNTKEETNE
jgi:hypothetical protein